MDTTKAVPKSRIRTKRVAFPIGPQSTGPSTVPSTKEPGKSDPLANEAVTVLQKVIEGHIEVALLNEKVSLVHKACLTGLPEQSVKLVNDIAIALSQKNKAKTSELLLQLQMTHGSGEWVTALNYIISKVN